PLKNYECSGILTNVTSNKVTKYERQVICRETSSGEVCKEETVAVTGVLAEGKKFYIRCKDQPELENDTVVINGISYSRNTMSESLVYELRNSDALKITDVSPSGKVYVGVNDSLELSAFTSSGANYGKATCWWKISNLSDFSGVSYSLFKNTNSTAHRQILNSNFLFGFNYVNVRCIDSADNLVYLNSTFNLVLDKTSPKVISISKSLDSLKIKTNENSKCYYSFDNSKKCLFSKENASEMQSLNENSHTASWENDKTFYIKCQDNRGNLASGCTVIVDTRAYRDY
ncbi:MAG: hypothetical protein Q8L27_03090, partial [archaeon]|nr:hypothetical protein [archaeon]